MFQTPSLRRVVMTAVAASVVALAIGGVSIARAGGHHATNHTFTLTETDTNFHFVSISHTKTGRPGDEFIFHGKLTAAGAPNVGSIDVVCTLVFGGNSQCMGTFTLPGGTVTGSALVPTNGTAVTHIAVSGGTGRFANVRGQVLSTSTGTNTSTDVFHLNY